MLNKIFIFLLLSTFSLCKKQKPLILPKPELTSDPIKRMFGIDKNINIDTIDNYLFNKNIVYRDVRMLVDEADYRKIGGDSYLSGYVKGFEVVPLPYLINVSNLPKVVGETYRGQTLYKYNKKNIPIPQFRESKEIIEKLFPKNKYIFLMCGGGGYSLFMKNLLISLGWNKDKIYIVGGYWDYQGKNDVKVKVTHKNKTTYDFSKVKYHEIKFDKLHKIN